LMGGLLHLVQRGGAWAEPQPAQSPPRCTKCNSPPINGDSASVPITVLLYNGQLLCSFNVSKVKKLLHSTAWGGDKEAQGAIDPTPNNFGKVPDPHVGPQNHDLAPIFSHGTPPCSTGVITGWFFSTG